jgi:hypothetical protein
VKIVTPLPDGTVIKVISGSYAGQVGKIDGTKFDEAGLLYFVLLNSGERVCINPGNLEERELKPMDKTAKTTETTEVKTVPVVKDINLIKVKTIPAKIWEQIQLYQPRVNHELEEIGAEIIGLTSESSGRVARDAAGGLLIVLRGRLRKIPYSTYRDYIRCTRQIPNEGALKKEWDAERDRLPQLFIK